MTFETSSQSLVVVFKDIEHTFQIQAYPFPFYLQPLRLLPILMDFCTVGLETVKNLTVVQYLVGYVLICSPGVIATNLHRRAGQSEEQYEQVKFIHTLLQIIIYLSLRLTSTMRIIVGNHVRFIIIITIVIFQPLYLETCDIWSVPAMPTVITVSWC